MPNESSTASWILPVAWCAMLLLLDSLALPGVVKQVRATGFPNVPGENHGERGAARAAGEGEAAVSRPNETRHLLAIANTPERLRAIGEALRTAVGWSFIQTPA